MYLMLAQIADHVVSFKTSSSIMAEYIEEKFGSLRIVERLHNCSPDLLIEIEAGYGSVFEDYQVDITAGEQSIDYRRTDYHLQMDSAYQSAKVYVYDEFALKHALVNIYSSFITYRQWGLLIHSSCMLEGTSGYVFAGQSGAGKSTVAQLSWPRPIISDEATIIKVSSGEIVTFASPFRSDSDIPDLPGKFALSAIQLLRQSPSNRRIAVSKMEAMLQLINRVFYWAHDPVETKKIMRMCKQLVDHVPVYELFFQKNNTFWEEISS